MTRQSISRRHTGEFAFRPIDDGARDGGYVLLRDDAGHQHCGRWNGREWAYSSGARIARPIVAYCARRTPAERNTPETGCEQPASANARRPEGRKPSEADASRPAPEGAKTEGVS
jgi:hypothetical protein